jgi:hypothetical protein
VGLCALRGHADAFDVDAGGGCAGADLDLHMTVG